jgi:para-nitrobenzyl esterase
MSAETFEAVVRETFGDRADQVKSRYSPEKQGSAALAWAAVVTDRMWSCTQYETAKKLAAKTNVYEYEFADPNPPKLSPQPPLMPLGAQHASELWDFFDLAGPPKFTEAQQRLSDEMIRDWAEFARTGISGWPPFTGKRGYVQSFAPDDIRPVELAAEHHCDFWKERE